MKAAIFSIYMDNIDPKTVELQKAVVTKRNKSSAPHLLIKTNKTHAQAIDYIWSNDFRKVVDFDVALFLDIDAIPLNPHAINDLIETAANGLFIGDAQSSNHINEGKHIFVAPSVFAISRPLYEFMGKPSADPTPRGDVLEEYTWALEERNGVALTLDPLGYKRHVVRMPWETDKSHCWKLPNGKEYGIGTTFGWRTDMGKWTPMFYHNFQIFHADHQQFFQDICRQELAKED